MKARQAGTTVTLAPVSRDHWDQYVSMVRQFNLLQSWDYGDAKVATEGWRCTRSLLLEGGQPMGMAQVLHKRWPVGGLARINRGPLLFSSGERETSSGDSSKALLALRQHWVVQRRHVLSLVPEIPPATEAGDVLAGAGFLAVPGASHWTSSLVDLGHSPDELRRALRGKWRNLLSKSERMDLELEADSSSTSVEDFLRFHRSIQQAKGFGGVPESLVRKLAQDKEVCQVLFARSQGQRVSGVLVAGHGDSCTYLMGWNSEEGRRLDANYFLIWNAFLLAQSLDYRWFDMGGYNDALAPGVAHFKQGVGGQEYELLGEHICSPNRLLTSALLRLRPLLGKRAIVAGLPRTHHADSQDTGLSTASSEAVGVQDGASRE